MGSQQSTANSGKTHKNTQNNDDDNHLPPQKNNNKQTKNKQTTPPPPKKKQQQQIQQQQQNQAQTKQANEQNNKTKLDKRKRGRSRRRQSERRKTNNLTQQQKESEKAIMKRRRGKEEAKGAEPVQTHFQRQQQQLQPNQQTQPAKAGITRSRMACIVVRAAGCARQGLPITHCRSLARAGQGPYAPQGSTSLLPKLSRTSKVSAPTSYAWVGSRVHFRSSEDVTLLEFTSPADREYMRRRRKFH